MKYSTLCIFLLCGWFFLPTTAANENNNKETLASTSAQVSAIEHPIRAEIITLVKLLTSTPSKANVLLQQLIRSESRFNVAEQYLMLLAKATLKQSEAQHQAVISLLEQAKLLRKHIATEQLTSPFFSNAYLVLANSYVAIKDYHNAYLAQKAFVDEYNDFSDIKRDNTVQALTKKYELSHKIAANQLLDNQNKLKELQIADVHRAQQEQQRQALLIIATIIVFILLFLRQLKVRKKLLLLMKTDSLTGLLNRDIFFKQGYELAKSAHQQQQPLSVLLFDIDHFKSINDQFGHGVGDLVLAKIAKLVLETMRSRDIFARIGGEEFAAILPNTDIDKTKAIAMRVIEKITQHNFNDLGVNQLITLSVGVASAKDCSKSFDELLHSADLAMNYAQAQGSNQMVSYDKLIRHKLTIVE